MKELIRWPRGEVAGKSLFENVSQKLARLARNKTVGVSDPTLRTRTCGRPAARANHVYHKGPSKGRTARTWPAQSGRVCGAAKANASLTARCGNRFREL
ncbi:hypothetical protein EVAR_92889_1 [Eumeta japonica]|uniref:Uncharacterized protein n=1 Tax=Eumeta variegata TaxID=151549 RepID=A0A4C1TDJ5_EUMVA|nr:hypothetical protein EVAR_92889_1 [Eumeta japonica]